MNRVESINEVTDSNRGLEKIVDSQEFHTDQYQVSTQKSNAPTELIRDTHDAHEGK